MVFPNRGSQVARFGVSAAFSRGIAMINGFRFDFPQTPRRFWRERGRKKRDRHDWRSASTRPPRTRRPGPSGSLSSSCNPDHRGPEEKRPGSPQSTGASLASLIGSRRATIPLYKSMRPIRTRLFFCSKNQHADRRRPARGTAEPIAGLLVLPIQGGGQSSLFHQMRLFPGRLGFWEDVGLFPSLPSL